MKRLIYISSFLLCLGCSSTTSTEKYQDKRDHIVEMKEKVKALDIEEVLVGSYSLSYVLGDYILIADYKSFDKLVHILDAKTLRYITSCVNKGEGPEEVLNMGCLGIDEAHKTFYVTDHAKFKIFSYPIDSVLTNPFYTPQVKTEIDATQFPSEYQYFNDTLCIGRIISPIGTNDYKPVVSKWNMLTGKITTMEYEHPDIQKKRILCMASAENNIYVECYQNRDLMTICTLDGKLKYNIYGPNWNEESKGNTYYHQPVICKDKILVPYSGSNTRSDKSSPSKILVFDIDGNYLQTLDVGYKINGFCYDKQNNRLFLNFNDEIQFATLDMNGTI